MKHDLKATANAFAAFIGILYLVCGFFIAVFPGISKAVTVSWFHGIDIGEIWSAKPFPGNFLLGFVSAVISAWVSGWAFAWLYNYFAKK